MHRTHRRSWLSGAGALLVGAALLLSAAPGQARLVRPNEPAAPVAERGGQNLQPGAAQGRRACAFSFDAMFLLPFGLPCLGLPQIEAMTRLTVGVQRALAAERREWRAPRLARTVSPRRDSLAFRAGPARHHAAPAPHLHIRPDKGPRLR